MSELEKLYDLSNVIPVPTWELKDLLYYILECRYFVNKLKKSSLKIKISYKLHDAEIVLVHKYATMNSENVINFDKAYENMEIAYKDLFKQTVKESRAVMTQHQNGVQSFSLTDPELIYELHLFQDYIKELCNTDYVPQSLALVRYKPIYRKD